MNANSPNDRRPSASSLGPVVLLAMILGAALSRLLPTPPNFSPVEAMALFGGAYFAARWLALLVPVLAMLVADFALAAMHGGLYAQHLFTPAMLVVYGCIVAIGALGFLLRGRVTGPRVLGRALASAAGFFLITNFAAWWVSPMYPPTAAGLGASYVAAIPFFKWSVLSTLFYAALLFGGFELLRRRAPAMHARTV